MIARQRMEVIGAVREVLCAQSAPAVLLALSPRNQIVSLTVTERATVTIQLQVV